MLLVRREEKDEHLARRKFSLIVRLKDIVVHPINHLISKDLLITFILLPYITVKNILEIISDFFTYTIEGIAYSVKKILEAFSLIFYSIKSAFRRTKADVKSGERSLLNFIKNTIKIIIEDIKELFYASEKYTKEKYTKEEYKNYSERKATDWMFKII